MSIAAATPALDFGAEESLLGAMLCNDSAADKGAAMGLGDDFYLPRNRRIYSAMVALHDAGQPVDVITVAAKLQADSNLKVILHLLADKCPAAAHVVEYGNAVRQAADHYRLQTALEQMQAGAQADGKTPVELHRWLGEVLASAAPADKGDGGPKSTIVCAADIDVSQAGSVEWLVDGFVAAGNLTGITAAPKVGKTTLAISMADSLANGKPFLDRPTTQTGVVYLTEQSPSSFANQLGRAGLLGCPNLYVMYRSATRQWDWPTIIAGAVDHALTVDARVLIVDTLGDWTIQPVEGWENDAGLALQALQPLHDAMANHGLGVVVLRHARKGAGDAIEEARGSSAYPGGLDIVLSLRKVGGVDKAHRRTLCDAGSRPEGVPSQLVIEYTEPEYRVLGDATAVAQHEARGHILTKLTNDFERALTEKEIVKLCHPIKAGTVHIVLGRLVNDGLVLRGKGAGSASARSYGFWQANALP
jgi:hypothetical protein